MGPHPAVAAIRLAVRRALHDILNEHQASGPTPHERPPSPLVLVACSGGADSMALASALAFEAPKLGIRAGGVTVDHGLQDGSDLRADEVVLRLRELGLDPVESIAVTVGREGGPEAAARDARYAALDACAARHGATAVLLGHTRDDQAETVLLGLARGSGTRSLSGMAAVSGADGRYRRPFLQLDRQTARKALARTAQLSRDDADALDAWASQAETAVRDATGLLECAKLYALPPAVRRRILRRAAIEAGAPAGSLFARHIEELDRLITGWRGQGAINLPGKVVAQRQGGRLVIRQG